MALCYPLGEIQLASARNPGGGPGIKSRNQPADAARIKAAEIAVADSYAAVGLALKRNSQDLVQHPAGPDDVFAGADAQALAQGRSKLQGILEEKRN